MDESRELIEIDDETKEVNYLPYCFCMKSLYDMRERNCKFCICGTCASPIMFIADMIALPVQLIINNVKLCLR